MSEELSKKIGNIADDLITDVNKYCKQELKTREKFANIAKIVFAVAACMIILIGAGMFWIYNHQVIECSSKERIVSIEGRNAVYQYVSMTRGEYNKLSDLKGDMYSKDDSITFYKSKGGLALQYLIMEQAGQYYKLRFLEYCNMYRYSDVLRVIYGIKGASDIKQIVIGKDKYSEDNNIPTVILTDDLSKEKLLNILNGIKSINPDSIENDKETSVKNHNNISRLISVKLVDGSVLDYIYGPYDLHMTGYVQQYIWSYLDVDDCGWLNKQARIELE